MRTLREVYDGVWDFPVHAGSASVWIWAGVLLLPALALLSYELKSEVPLSARLARRGPRSKRFYSVAVYLLIAALFLFGMWAVSTTDDSDEARKAQLDEFLRSEGIVVTSPSLLPGFYPAGVQVRIRVKQSDGVLGPEEKCGLSTFRKFADGSWQMRMPRRHEGGGRHVRVVIMCPEPSGSR